MIVVHAGNRTDSAEASRQRFPESAVASVTDRVERLLAALQPEAVVSAPAAGADLIVLAAAQRAGIPVHVFVPLPVDEFERRSVADRGARWIATYHDVLEAARSDRRSSVDVADLHGESPPRAERRWYLAANTALIDLARSRADAVGAALLALTIRPVECEEPPSATDDFALKAANAGLVVLTLDPRPGVSALAVTS